MPRRDKDDRVDERAEYHIGISRTISTAQFESVRVELQGTFELAEHEVDAKYKEMSARLEKYVVYEERKYGKRKDSKSVK